MSGGAARPVHDKKASGSGAWPNWRPQVGLVTLADKGYEGAEHAKILYQSK